MNVFTPKIKRAEPVLDPVPTPAEAAAAEEKKTTGQLAPKPATASESPLPKKTTRRFRIDLGDSGFGSGLNIPT